MTDTMEERVQRSGKKANTEAHHVPRQPTSNVRDGKNTITYGFNNANKKPISKKIIFGIVSGIKGS